MSSRILCRSLLLSFLAGKFVVGPQKIGSMSFKLISGGSVACFPRIFFTFSYLWKDKVSVLMPSIINLKSERPSWRPAAAYIASEASLALHPWYATFSFWVFDLLFFILLEDNPTQEKNQE